ncbi:MAG: YIP1 family protein [Candidatus Limnocylindria bacterium]
MTATTIDRSINSRMLRAARLDAAVYEEVEHDTTATGQAALVVVITSVLAGIGTGATGGLGGMIWGVIAALLAWAVYAWITFFVGTTILRGPETRADWGEVARGLGFASAPRALLVFAFIPVAGALLGFAVAIWILVTTVIALREALDFSTGRAIGTAVIGWLMQLIIFALVFSLL